MKTITLKTQCGKHTVTVNNEITVFGTMREALVFISKERGLTK